VRVLRLQAVERRVGDAQAASKGEQSQVSNHDGLHKGPMGTAATPTGVGALWFRCRLYA
jgi:hypothetical protein